MGPAAGLDEHRDLVGHRQPRGAAKTELTHRVGIAHRLCRSNVDGFRPVRSRDASTRDSKCFVSVSMAVGVETRHVRTRLCSAARGRKRPVPPPRRVLPSESKAGRRVAAKGCTTVRGHRCRQGGQCGRPRLEADTTGEP